MPSTTAKSKRAQSSKPTARRTTQLAARLTKTQISQIERAAACTGRSLDDFVVDTLSEAAQSVLRQHQVWKLDREQSLAMAEALLNPPEPNEALRAAARKYHQTVVSR